MTHDQRPVPPQPAPPEKSSGAAPSASAEPVFDRARVHRLIQDIGVEAAVEIRAAFIGDLQERLARLNGLLSEDERQNLRIEAHSLKSSSAALGLAAISKKALEIEKASLTAPITDLAAMVEMLHLLAEEGVPIVQAAF